MRELKFRVFAHERDDEGCVGFLEGDGFLNFYYDGGWRSLSYFIKFPDFTVQQFTSLKDKNEKEIYEGDIIQKIVNGEHIYTYIVGYDESKASFTIKDSLESLISFVPVDTFQIIGNIFENPEILKQ